MARQFNIIKATPQALSEHINEQITLMGEINAKCVMAGRKPQFDDPKNFALTHELIRKDDGTYQLMKRKDSLAYGEDGNGNPVIVRTRMTVAEQAYGKNFVNRSKDETTLFVTGNDICSVEMKELM